MAVHLFKFNKLSQELPIKSIDDLQSSDYFGDLKLHIRIGKSKGVDDISREQYLKIVTEFLDKIQSEINKKSVDKIGSEFQRTSFDAVFGQPKEKIVDIGSDQSSSMGLVKESWYVLDKFIGTSEEARLVELIQSNIQELQKDHQVYLVRNEEVYKIYGFDNGVGFCPDFLLFMMAQTII